MAGGLGDMAANVILLSVSSMRMRTITGVMNVPLERWVVIYTSELTVLSIYIPSLYRARDIDTFDILTDHRR